MMVARFGWTALALAWLAFASPALAGETPDQGIARLDAHLTVQPDDLDARAERARLLDAAGRPMAAFLDRQEILRRRPDDVDMARLAAHDLADAGAPQAAQAFLQRYPAALSGDAGAALSRRIEGDLAARHVRWGWAEPVLDPAQRRHEAETAIAALEAMHRSDPGDPRAAGDLLLAYRLAERMDDVVALWESTLRSGDPPAWLRVAAADAYLALHRTAEAEALYRSLARQQPESPEPWIGLYWTAIDQRRYADADTALKGLAKIPGQELTAEIQRAWLLLFENRTDAGRARFEALFEEHPGDPRIRQGLATADLWQGEPRQGLHSVEELLARTTRDEPRIDNPSARISRAGALASLGDLAEARRQAIDLALLYPDNVHAQRLRRDIDTQLAPEVRLEGRYETSDRGLGEAWSLLEVSLPVGTRMRFAAGGSGSRSEDDRYADADMREAHLGMSLRPSRWLSLSGEVAWDVSDQDFRYGAAGSVRAALLPSDRWRIDLGTALDSWRDLPLRARAAGITADSFDAGLSYSAGTRWSLRLGGERSKLTDGNERTAGLVALSLLARQGPLYRATFGAEVYASENSTNDVVYFSPLRSRSMSLTHRSEWLTATSGGRRHSFVLLAHAGMYDQEGFDQGLVGGAWLESSWDLAGRTVLVLGGGARSQLYDGSRELDPRFYLTLRRRF
jgi:tetratricopeptide (TPR) repeat protein